MLPDAFQNASLGRMAFGFLLDYFVKLQYRSRKQERGLQPPRFSTFNPRFAALWPACSRLLSDTSSPALVFHRGPRIKGRVMAESHAILPQTAELPKLGPHPRARRVQQRHTSLSHHGLQSPLAAVCLRPGHARSLSRSLSPSGLTTFHFQTVLAFSRNGAKPSALKKKKITTSDSVKDLEQHFHWKQD